MTIFSPADVQLVNESMILIWENISLHRSILYLTVSDRDTGENGRLRVELLSGDAILRLEQVKGNTYTLINSRLFDRETTSLYSFSLFIYDHGQPKNSLIYPFELHLLDVNDCAPYFESVTQYSFYINENNAENVVLHRIGVHDPDDDDQITLHLEFNRSTDESLFYLNAQNELLVRTSLDCETQSFYSFLLVAEDRVKHRTSIFVYVTVKDLNDNVVKFLRHSSEFQIEDNLPDGTCIGQLQAEDHDQTSRVLYEIHADDLLRMDRLIDFYFNGSFYSRAALNDEQFDRLSFRVIANDSLHTDEMTIDLRRPHRNTSGSMLKTLSPYCFVSEHNETITIQLDVDSNVSFSMRHPSSSDLHLLPNGTLIVHTSRKHYSFDLYLHDTEANSVVQIEHFVLWIVEHPSQCPSHSFHRVDQRIFWLYFFCLTLCISCSCCLFAREQRQLLDRKRKRKSTPSLSASINDPVEQHVLLLASPSPQLTTLSTSTHLTSSRDQSTKKNCTSLSSSSSSTYIKISHSFDEEII